MPGAWEVIQITPGAPPGVTMPAPQPGKLGVQPSQQNEKFLAICIPHLGEVTSEWAMKLRDLQLPFGTKLFMSRGMPIDVTREAMARAVWKEGFEWLFFLDSDVILPSDAIMKLISHGLPIVNGMYKAKKREGFYWAVWVACTNPENGKPGFCPVESWTGRFIKVDVIGAGCMLIHRSVFDKLSQTDQPWFLWTKDRHPRVLDLLNPPDPRMKELSEDFWFCLLAKHNGYDIVVDTEIKCGHISTVKLEDKGVGLPDV